MNLHNKLESLLLKIQNPARYIGGEFGSIIKNKSDISLRFAFCFPDVYEIGMSHLGTKIIYSLLNSRDDIWCERVFAPAPDMESIMRGNQIPLYGLESLDPIKYFDIIGFTLQYELCYTGVLDMLDLAGLPVRSSDRKGLWPLIIAGGPCACNPEPIADFIDLFVLGEGEEVAIELCELYQHAKAQSWDKSHFLRTAASSIQGIYVPSLYDVHYNLDGTVSSISPKDGAPATIRKRIVKDLDSVFFPDSFVVPSVEAVHDRSIVEVMRGCVRGCRFCQAGFIYRPVREKSAETLSKNAKDLSSSTGYDEVSLTSLSTSDYTQLSPLLEDMLKWTEKQRINVALPSLRLDNFSAELQEKIAIVRKSGLTFAPEAGTQRLRDVINKNITEDDIMRACKLAFEGGHDSVKLYFMLGLPTETMEDVAGIAGLAQRIVDLFYSLPGVKKGRGVGVSISAACFVPKPFTPFMFEPQDTIEMFREKQKYLKSCIKSRKISFKYHDPTTSCLEAVLARGDRRLCAVVEDAWRSGSRLDGWDENLSIERWNKAFEKNGVDTAFYTARRRDYSEFMPWDHLDYRVSKEFFIKESKAAWEGTVCK